MDNEWIDSEIEDLQCDRKAGWKKHRDNSLFLRLMVFLIPMLIYSVFIDSNETRPCYVGHRAWYVSDGRQTGINWKCKNCGARHWTAERAKDWKGDIYCARCGSKK